MNGAASEMPFALDTARIRVSSMIAPHDPCQADNPYNHLPTLPRAAELETHTVLKRCIKVRTALKQAAERSPNLTMLIVWRAPKGVKNGFPSCAGHSSATDRTGEIIYTPFGERESPARSTCQCRASLGMTTTYTMAA